MGRMYSCPFGPTAATAAVDFLELIPADDKPLIVHAIYIGQTTEFGDAQDETLEVQIARGGSGYSSGSGGAAAANGQALDASAATSGFTFEAMNTTNATFTAGGTVLRDAFNVRVGWQYRPAPQERISVSQANGGLTVKLGASPADSITWTGSAIVEELG